MTYTKTKAAIDRLTAEQYRVTQENGTESPYSGEYCRHNERGLYVDIVSGEPLFASIHKFDGGTGWASFTRPVVSWNLVERVDHSLGLRRTEVRSRHGDSHLGHVFGDASQFGGVRYCINSAALRFVPVSEMADGGYAEFLPIFGAQEPVAGK